MVAIVVSLSLWATGVLNLEQALAGFGDPAVLFVAWIYAIVWAVRQERAARVREAEAREELVPAGA